MIHLTPENHRRFLRSNETAAIYFYADWCGPCWEVNKKMQWVHLHFGERCAFAQINIDDEVALTQKYGIRNIPMLIFFYRGKGQMSIMGRERFKVCEQKIAAWLSDIDFRRSLV